MKKSIFGAVVAAGAVAAGAALLFKNKKPAEPQPVTTAEALLTPQLQAQLADHVAALVPDNGFAMVLSDDRGDLSRVMAQGCRMLFSADGSGAAAEPRAYWPENIIRADCDLQRLWLAANSLDLAVLVNVLQRFEDTTTVLTDLQRVLKPGAELVLATTVRTEAFSESAWASTMELLGIPAKQAWTAEELRSLLSDSGWEVLSEELMDGSFSMVIHRCRSVQA